jgi:predicted nucleic acid-binding protein
LEPEDALMLLDEEVLRRFQVLDLPRRARAGFLQAVRQDRIAGGRIHDVHIAEIARAGGAKVVVTDNRRHFLSLLRHDIRVLSSAEFRP